jgi:hypothetical protein
MGAAAVDTVPVVSRANIRQAYGVVTLPDILAAYGLAKQTPPDGAAHGTGGSHGTQ